MLKRSVASAVGTPSHDLEGVGTVVFRRLRTTVTVFSRPSTVRVKNRIYDAMASLTAGLLWTLTT